MNESINERRGCLLDSPGYTGSVKNTKTKTKKVRRVVYNRYSLIDIPNHAAGVEDGAWDVFFDLAAKSNLS